MEIINYNFIKRINTDSLGPSKRIGSRVNTSLNFQNTSSNNQLLQTSNSANLITSKQIINSKPRRFTSNLSSSFVNDENLSNNNNHNNNNNNNNNSTLPNNQSDDMIDDDDDDSSLDMESDSEQTYIAQNNEETSNTSNSLTKKVKLKVNPFAPSLIKPKMSFERRRWAHLFPLRDDGTPIFENVTVKTTTDGDNPEQSASININNNNISSPQTNGTGLTSSQHKHGSESSSNINNSNPYLALNERDNGLLGFQKASPDSNKFYDNQRKNYE